MTDKDTPAEREAKSPNKGGAAKKAERARKKGGKPAPGKGKPQSKEANKPAKKKKKGGGKPKNQKKTKKFEIPKSLAEVISGAHQRNAVEYEFQVKTRVARDTFEFAVVPAAWIYRDTVSRLAKTKNGAIIAEVNQVLNEAADRAIKYHKSVRDKVDAVMERHEAAMPGVTIRRKEPEKVGVVKIVSVGGVTSRLITIVTEFDQAAVTCELAWSADAMPYELAQQYISQMIVYNRQVKNAMKGIGRFVREQLKEDEFDHQGLRDYAQASMQTRYAQISTDEKPEKTKKQPTPQQPPAKTKKEKATDEGEAAKAEGKTGGKQSPVKGLIARLGKGS
jgi:hypothetical protein